MNQFDGDVSRRSVLGLVGAGSVALAGCASSGGNEDDSSGEPPAGSDSPVLGDPDAGVTLEVYEDFSCPHCRDYNQNEFPTLKAEYLDPGRIRYEHRDLPFINEQSWQAANAAREAYLHHGSEAFWAYKSELFARQGDLGSGTPDIFGEIATALELDGEQIQSAAVNREHDSLLEADKNRGTSLGVEGTPSFVLDGKLVDRNTVSQEIDAALE